MEIDDTENGQPLFLDVSGLEPPEPLVQVLARVDSLGSGQYLLYPNLEKRGFDYLSCGNDAYFHIFIWRKDDAEAERAVRAAIGELCRG